MHHITWHILYNINSVKNKGGSDVEITLAIQS